jgi:glucose/arabinose dehydrogenase
VDSDTGECTLLDDSGADPDEELQDAEAVDGEALDDPRSEQDASTASADAGVDMDASSQDPGLDGGVMDAAQAEAEVASEAGAIAEEAGDDAGVDGAVDAGLQVPPCQATTAPAPGRLGLTTVFQGVPRLVYAAQAPGSDDWYLVQQSGQILVRAPGATTGATLLDVSAELSLRTAAVDERGLLGLAFAPDYATSGVFYVMLTLTSSQEDQVRAYRQTGAGATYLDTLLTVPASADNHNGGNVIMHDGLLYVGTGDGGGRCNSDKPDAPQLISGDPTALFGKILRLDPTRKAQGFAAMGNPFPESPLVLHYGLRNPYRFSFDRVTGDLFIGDVGQEASEEIDFAAAGAAGVNFGWPAFEASTSTCARALRTGSTNTKPIFEADRRVSGCTGPYCDWTAVVGGVVYRGNQIPKLRGTYLAGDYWGDRMVLFNQCGAVTSPVTMIPKQCDPNYPNEACFENSTLDILYGIVEDNAGEIHLIANGDQLLKVIPLP